MATKKVDVRLESDLWLRLERFMLANHIETPSATIRALIEVGLRDMTSIETAWSAAAVVEGRRKAAHEIREKIDETLAKLKVV